MSVELPKAYEPQHVEKRIYDLWTSLGLFQPALNGKPYCIMLPPPNVTGTLHMGHAFQDTLMDILIRKARMEGRRVLWQVGTDHAGIATQMVVERELQKEGLRRTELGRDQFMKRVWEWKERSGQTIINQMMRLGCSADWARQRFTLDPEMNQAVMEAFIRLYHDGLIYRGRRLVNWDPVFETALSDLEVRFDEEDGFLWYIRYHRLDGKPPLVVATTRPETLFGDVAIAVHPDDTRYHELHGKSVRLPIGNRTIPVVSDSFVDSSFGTGCVKITPAHDFHDFEVWERLHEKYRLPLFRILDSTGHIQDPARSHQRDGDTLYWLPPGTQWDAPELGFGELIPQAYLGLDRMKAREKVIEQLTESGLLEKIEPHRLSIPRGDRSGTILEPMLTQQWFVRTSPLAKKAIQAVQSGKIRFTPEHWEKTYFDWMHNIQDWCISRQLWWGHRIPAWSTPGGKWYVGANEEEIRTRYKLSSDMPLKQDTDVLDTWFSSALWPFSTLGWPHASTDLNAFYPTDVLVTGFDIIFFWVARMIMMSLHFLDDIPFRTVYVHALVRDAEGQKMSKSKGNVLDPLDLIDGIDLSSLVAKRTQGLLLSNQAKAIERATRKEYPQGIPALGTDALRFTFTALAAPGRDIRFNLNRIAGYRNFCNKLWNAGRFISHQVTTKVDVSAYDPAKGTAWDRWICSRFETAITAAEHALQNYRFDEWSNILYDFTWNEFCDWYLEASKIVFNHKDQYQEPARSHTRATLVTIYDRLLALLHPVIPYITEELWQQLSGFHDNNSNTHSLMSVSYPQSNAHLINTDIERQIQDVQQMIIAIRRLRSSYGIPDGRKIRAYMTFAHTTSEFCQFARNEINMIKAFSNFESLDEFSESKIQQMKGLAVAVTSYATFWIPLADYIDSKKETARIIKDLQACRGSLDKLKDRLSNSDFHERAPAALIKTELERLENLQVRCKELDKQLEALQTLN